MNLWITSPGVLCAAQHGGSGPPAARWPKALSQPGHCTSGTHLMAGVVQSYVPERIIDYYL